MTTPAPKIHVLHENDDWTRPLERELAGLGLPYATWFLDQGGLDLSRKPPPGIFYSRMSASSHTRGHRFAAEYTGCVLNWLEAHDRVVLNGSRALQLEVSKVAQYAALEAHGIRTPHTIAVVGRDEILAASRTLRGAFITKHNRGGKGLGVRLFEDSDGLARYLDSDDYQPPIDGVTLLQAYIHAPDQVITRCEFVGQRFLYALQVDTTDGFELCPAQQCTTRDISRPTPVVRPRFSVVQGFRSPLIPQYVGFMRAHDIHVAGIELIVDANGVTYTYDINTNTNYNVDAEAKVGAGGMRAIAQYLGRALADAYGRASAA